MIGSIDLNGHLRLSAKEVENEWPDRVLSAEVNAFQTSPSKLLPEQDFRQAYFLAQDFSELTGRVRRIHAGVLTRKQSKGENLSESRFWCVSLAGI